MVNNSKMEEDCDDKDDTKRKSRNLSEKKRRDQFNSLVNDLSALISTSNRKMDKSTVLKSTITFLKHHNEATDRSKVFEIQQDWKPSFLTNDEFTHLMLESLDGFIIVFSSRGTIYYASESVTSLLGYLPSDILNRSMYDLTYAKDHESLFNIFLNPKPVIEHLQTDINASNQITFFLYLKRGRCDSKDVTFYELVKFVGYFRNNVNLENLPAQNAQQPSPEIFRSKSLSDLDSKLIFVGTGRIQKPQLTREMCAIDPLRSEFTSKHSMEWKFLFLDQRAPPIIGYMPFEVLGTSGYDYYHFDDLDNIVECHEKLMQNGEGKSCYYRFLTKGQQWIWLQTDYYISYHQYNSKPDYVMCNHRVVSYADVRNENKQAEEQQHQHQEEELSGAKPNQVARKDYDNSTTGTFDASPVLAGTGESGPSVVPLSVGVGLLGEVSPSALETSNIWAELSSSATTPMTPPQKPSRPASSFGYISPGISPKRTKYLKPSRGNESDSTSISAESGTSRHSLLTHPSSGRQRHNSVGNVTHQTLAKHMNSRHCPQPNSAATHGPSQQMSLHPLISPTPMQLLDPSAGHQRGLGNVSGPQVSATAMPLTSVGVSQAQQKVIPMLPQQAVASTPILPTSTCQYSQSPFPLRSSQIVGSGFLEPPQYLAAIPVQPVISTFPVAPVLSPLPVSSATFAGHRLQPLQHDSSSPPDMIAAAAGVVMGPAQNQLQDRLQRRHDELQQIVMQKQDELRIVSEQLLLARYTYLQPVVPYNSLASPQNGRSPSTVAAQMNHNHNNNNNTIEPQFNQYGFALNSEQIQNNADQQMIMQQQHSLQHQHPNQQQQQQQTLQQNSQGPGPSSGGQNPSSVMQQSPASQLTHLLEPAGNSQQQQTVPPPPTSSEFDQFAGDDMDVFFNLSPLQSMTASQLNPLAGLQSRGGPQSAGDVNNVDGSGANNNNNTSSGNSPYVGGLDGGVVGGVGPPGPGDLPPIGEDNGLPVGVPNEDPILSYMQLATQNQFAMAISEDGSETQGEETKVLQDRLHQQQQQHHQQQQHNQQQQQHGSQQHGSQQHGLQHQQQRDNQQHTSQQQHSSQQHASQHQHQQQQQQQSQSQQQHNQQQQQHHQQHQQQTPPSQRSYFTGNPFETLNNSEVGVSDSIPNDLEILQYQMSQEQSQSLFNASAPAR